MPVMSTLSAYSPHLVLFSAHVTKDTQEMDSAAAVRNIVVIVLYEYE